MEFLVYHRLLAALLDKCDRTCLKFSFKFFYFLKFFKASENYRNNVKGHGRSC